MSTPPQLPILGRGLLPALPRTPWRERVRAAAGAGLGLLLLTLATLGLHRVDGDGWMLIAPLGATAVLVFAVPNSPLAQPWSAIVGNTVSALVGTAAVFLVPPPWTPGVAVGTAILAMILARALHPPGGAVALLAVIEAETVRRLGIGFALAPVAATTVLLVGAGVAYNRLTGRVYPFRQPDSQPVAERRLGLSTEELADLLARFNQSTNLGVADLARLLAAAEGEAVEHRFDRTPIAAIMTADPVTVAPDTPLDRAARLFRDHAIKSLPVVDAAGRLLGVVLQLDLVLALAGEPPRRSGIGRRPKLPFRGLRAADVMRGVDTTVSPQMPVGRLVNLLAVQHVQVVPVVDGARLVGVVTRSDLIGLLLRGAAERTGPVSPRPGAA